VASGGPNNIKTGNYTITLADILEGDKFLYNSASPGTFTLPTSGLVDGMVVNVAQIGAGAVTVAGGTIVGTTATTAQYQGLRFVYASTGTTWYSVAPSVTAPGLAIVTPTSIANSGGSASASGGQITFTGVSSISLNGVFSATYDNYLIRIDSDSTTGACQLRMRLAGTDNTSALYYSAYAAYAASGASAPGTASGITSVDLYGAASVAYTINMSSPALAVPTRASHAFQVASGASALGGAGGFTHNVGTAYDGFTFFGSTGNLTGKIRVYGLKNS
jgi:hypothetical protein